MSIDHVRAGQRGGIYRGGSKARAARENGKKGGRPRKYPKRAP